MRCFDILVFARHTRSHGRRTGLSKRSGSNHPPHCKPMTCPHCDSKACRPCANCKGWECQHHEAGPILARFRQFVTSMSVRQITAKTVPPASMTGNATKRRNPLNRQNKQDVSCPSEKPQHCWRIIERGWLYDELRCDNCGLQIGEEMQGEVSQECKRLSQGAKHERYNRQTRQHI